MGTTSTFDQPDYLGTFNLQTNSSQSTTATRVYDAFGNLESTTGTPQSPFGFVGSQGYQEDPNSGLKLLGHRYYDPSTGRFLARDPIQDGRNWYVYCQSGPTSAVDANGLQTPDQRQLISAARSLLPWVGRQLWPKFRHIHNPFAPASPTP